MSGLCRYIGREDMLMFLTKKEVDVIFPFMEDTPGGGRIYEPSFLEWVVSFPDKLFVRYFFACLFRKCT